jgi:hypothetical protein
MAKHSSLFFRHVSAEDKNYFLTSTPEHLHAPEPAVNVVRENVVRPKVGHCFVDKTGVNVVKLFFLLTVWANAIKNFSSVINEFSQ